MPARTEHTLTDPAAFAAELGRTRERGYALDEGEQEVGVRCVAVAVPGHPQPLALSVSGPLPRMTDDVRRTRDRAAARCRGRDLGRDARRDRLSADSTRRRPDFRAVTMRR